MQNCPLSCVYSILPGGRKILHQVVLKLCPTDPALPGQSGPHTFALVQLLLPPPLSLSFSLSFILCTTFSKAPNVLLYAPEYSSKGSLPQSRKKVLNSCVLGIQKCIICQSVPTSWTSLLAPTGALFIIMRYYRSGSNSSF